MSNDTITILEKQYLQRGQTIKKEAKNYYQNEANEANKSKRNNLTRSNR